MLNFCALLTINKVTIFIQLTSSLYDFIQPQMVYNLPTKNYSFLDFEHNFSKFSPFLIPISPSYQNVG